MNNYIIREALPNDAAAIAGLSEQLGYRVPLADIEIRLAGYRNDPARCVLVAEIGHTVAGWIEVGLANHLVSGACGEIAGLVVADGLRGHGIGSRLLEAGEKWISALGVENCVVRSRSTRLDAHRFYEREKYKLEKTSAVFTKKI